MGYKKEIEPDIFNFELADHPFIEVEELVRLWWGLCMGMRGW